MLIEAGKLPLHARCKDMRNFGRLIERPVKKRRVQLRFVDARLHIFSTLTKPIMNYTRSALLLAMFAAALVSFGCGKKNNSTTAATAPSGLRLANGVGTASLTMNAAGTSDTTVTLNSGSIAAGTAGSYTSVAPQTYTVGVGANDGSLISSTQSLALTTNVNTTVLAFPRDGAINTFVLTDNHVAPASGFASLTVANASSDAGSLDVYLVAHSAALNGISPVYPNVIAK